jgi:hypothetical protein
VFALKKKKCLPNEKKQGLERKVARLSTTRDGHSLRPTGGR